MGRGAGGFDSHQQWQIALILNKIQHPNTSFFSEKDFPIYLINYLSYLSSSALLRRLKSSWQGSGDLD